MKHQKLFVTALSIGAFLIAGCSAQENSTTSGGQIQTQEQNQSAAQLQIQSQTQLKDINSNQAKYSVEDRTAYQEATQANNASQCDKITNDQLKQLCKTSIADQATLKEAVTKSDVSLCANLSTPDLQNNCKTQVNAFIQQQQSASQQQGQISLDQKLSDQIVASGDYTKCSQIKSSGIEFACEVNILSEKAQSAKDASWCQKGSTQDIKNACVNSIQTTSK